MHNIMNELCVKALINFGNKLIENKMNFLLPHIGKIDLQMLSNMYYGNSLDEQIHEIKNYVREVVLIYPDTYSMKEICKIPKNNISEIVNGVNYLICPAVNYFPRFPYNTKEELYQMSDTAIE